MNPAKIISPRHLFQFHKSRRRTLIRA